MVQTIDPFNINHGLTEDTSDDGAMSVQELAQRILRAAAIQTDEQLRPVITNLERLYALLRKLTPEKRFLSAVDELNAEAAQAQAQQGKHNADPRVEKMAEQIDNLFTALNDLGERLPKIVESAATRIVETHLQAKAERLREPRAQSQEFTDPDGTGLEMDTGEE